MNPFTLEADDKPHRISSGAATPPEIEVDITRAESVGKSAKESFISTDMYKEKCIKAMERSNRGSGEKRLIEGENTRRLEKWNDFLCNDSNKQQLVCVILKVRSGNDFRDKLQNKTVLAVCEEKAFLLTRDGDGVSAHEIPMLGSDQEETDRRVILYCNYAVEQKIDYVRVGSPDSDIFFILMYYAPNLNITILFDTGSGIREGYWISLSWHVISHHHTVMHYLPYTRSLDVIRPALSRALVK